MSKTNLYNISYKNDDKGILIREFYKPNTLTKMKQNLRSLINEIQEMYDWKLDNEDFSDIHFIGEINSKKISLKIYKL